MDGGVGNALLELVWPTRCAGCEQGSELLCSSCKASLRSIELSKACPLCGAPFGFLICTECYSSQGKENHAFSAAASAFEMDELSGRLIVRYKDNNEQRLSLEFARMFAECIPSSWVAWAQALTWIPADSKALRRRGFDHMQKIAQDLSKMLDIACMSTLDKKQGKDQRDLSRSQRAQNLETLLSVTQSIGTLPHQIILIDDVYTTGATLNAASSKLKEAGVKEVRVASLVRVW